jgi:hypothetical protein
VQFHEAPDGTLMVREDDGTERPATKREQLDYLHDLDRSRWSTSPRDTSK